MLGLTSKVQQIFNMRLGAQWSHQSLGDGGKNSIALYGQYGFTESGLMCTRMCKNAMCNGLTSHYSHKL